MSLRSKPQNQKRQVWLLSGKKLPGEYVKRLFFQSPLFRTILLIAAVLICVAGVAVATHYAKVYPVIDSVDPPVATGGDIITITGKGFSAARNTGYVEIGGNSITESGYISWTDARIVLRLPPNVKDGLLCVVTSEGKSEPKIFTNSIQVPRPLRAAQFPSTPRITKLSGETLAPGKLLVITGENFGETRNSAYVSFTPSNIQQAGYERGDEIIPAQADFDYETWSNTEIRLRVPDGAVTGTVNIVTDKGTSNAERLTVTSPVGTKQIEDKRTYLVNVSADISNVTAEDTSAIILRIPRPITNSIQPHVEMREITPEPVIKDYNNMVIHQMQTKQSAREKAVFSQNFVITVRGVTTNISENKVQPYTDKARLLYKMYTTPDSLVQSGEKITALANQIARRETNPYIQARLIYNYMLDNYKLLDEVRAGNPSPLDVLETSRGDAYDFAVVFASLARALGIPCVPIAGVLVESEPRNDGALNSFKTRSHWWNLFYLEDFGWVPVDCALGAGMTYNRMRRNEDPRAFYFGSLDSQHIAFSIGWKTVKPSLVNSKSVFRPRTYAFQSIWEEASGTVKEYSSFWNEPAVLGLY
jgi:hypothetical protein